jgi:hypothetical protein
MFLFLKTHHPIFSNHLCNFLTGGHFYNLDLSFNQDDNRLFLACPSAHDTRPYTVLVFELWAIRNHKNKVCVKDIMVVSHVP